MTFRPKVFGIGFHKTGTTSLATALKILGYRVTGPNGIDNPRIAEEALSTAKELLEQYDAFQDNPWTVLFRELDVLVPGSKFILTTRRPDEWLKSVVKHFGKTKTPMRNWIYGAGSPVGNEERYLSRYKRHNDEVRAYFADRPESLLELSVTDGAGWDRICPYLGAPKPVTPFPYRNRAIERSYFGGTAMRLLRKFGGGS